MVGLGKRCGENQGEIQTGCWSSDGSEDH